MSNKLYDKLFKRELRNGDKLCGDRITPMSHGIILKVKKIYKVSSLFLTSDTPLIMASRLGHTSMVWGFIKCAKQTNTNLHNGESGEFQEFLWLRNKENQTALDVAIREGHVEVAKLLLENASLEYLISKRNYEGKLPVSMLPSPEHDMIILHALEEATKAAVDLPESILIQIDHDEDCPEQEPNAYTDSIMDPKSYPLSHENNTRTSLEKLDRRTLELTPKKNTILHLVSNIGDIKYAHDIIVKHPSLLYHRNSQRETPAYVAAREGHADILAAMINNFKINNDDIESLLTRSIDKHTALHIAIQNHHVGVAFWLIKEVPRLANLVNDFNESPIYLAAERGYHHLLNQMLECRSKTFEGPNGKTALHAAAISGSKECITYLLGVDIDKKIRDEHGWTPFRYAVHHNNASATAELVDADPSIVNEIMEEDDIYTFAVHIAASRGYCETLEALMSHCPGCSELHDGKGKNIFHVAVENKKTEVIELIYRDKSYTSLVNEKDKDGNTPMHLLMASDLEKMEVAMDYRVSINAKNNEKLTPLDMASSSEKRKKLLERVAASSHVQDKRSPSTKNSLWNKKRTEEEFQFMENLLIVATLIATATFAAAFTVPGGFDGNEGSKQGMPILLRKTAFKTFMFTNTAAFASSCSVLGSHVLLLVYRLKSNEVDDETQKSIHTRIVGMYYITGFSLLCMVVAFITGIYVVLSPIHGLAIFLCVLPLWTPVYTIFFPSLIGSSADMFIDLLWSIGKRMKR